MGYYTHYQEPEFGLLQLGVRYYDPSIGRFSQRDPAKDGLNWYAYVEGKPLGAVDPEGEATRTIKICRSAKGAKLASHYWMCLTGYVCCWGFRPVKGRESEARNGKLVPGYVRRENDQVWGQERGRPVMKGVVCSDTIVDECEWKGIRDHVAEDVRTGHQYQAGGMTGTPPFNCQGWIVHVIGGSVTFP